MALYGWELRKIIKRRSSGTALLLALCWTAIIMGLNIYFNNSYKINEEIPRIPGPQEIQNQLDWAEPWQGPLTESKMMAVQQQVYETYQNDENLDDEGELSEETWNREIRPILAIWNVISDFGSDVSTFPIRNGSKLIQQYCGMLMGQEKTLWRHTCKVSSRRHLIAPCLRHRKAEWKYPLLMTGTVGNIRC